MNVHNNAMVMKPAGTYEPGQARWNDRRSQLRRRQLLGALVTLPFAGALPAYRQRDFAVGYGATPAMRLQTGLALLGGIGRFVPPGARVLIKPNAGYARDPLEGATTDPQMLSAVVRELRRAGAKTITVADNPVDDAQAAFARSGLQAACKDLGVRQWLPSALVFDEARGLENCSLFAAPLESTDVVVNLATAKAHPLIGVSGAMTNLLGFFGGERAALHGELAAALPRLERLVRPQLNIVDGGRVVFSIGPAAGTHAALASTPWLGVGTRAAEVDAWVWRALLRRQDPFPFTVGHS